MTAPRIEPKVFRFIQQDCNNQLTNRVSEDLVEVVTDIVQLFTTNWLN